MSKDNRIPAQEKINSLLKKSLADNDYSFEVLADVPLNTVEYVAEHFGIDLSNFKYVVDSAYIRHTINRHGVGSNDRSPISLSDFTHIPFILSNFDSISLGSVKQNGNKVLVFKKQIGSEYYYVTAQEIRNRRKSVVMNDLYKRKKPQK